MKNTNSQKVKSKTIQSRKSKREKIVITCEILPPGTLKRNSYADVTRNPQYRWEEIVELCSKVIAENSKEIQNET